MKFINRTGEIKQLTEYFELSKKRLFVLAISGLRRVGKTTLIKEFIKKKKSIYFFVYENKLSDDLITEFTGELRKKGIITELENAANWDVFFDIIFSRCKDYIIIFDEAQNFFEIDKSIFSILQRKCDEQKDFPLQLIFLGSVIGLFKKIFEDKKQPLFGRLSATINLQPFDLVHSMEALSYLNYKNFEDMLKIYGIFGGFPKYYAVLEEFDLLNKDFSEIVEYLFMQQNAPLENEIPYILKQEFGRRSALYYSILHAIAIGKNTLNEIATLIGMKESSITRHLAELEDRFNLIKAFKPLANKKKSRYFITHSLVKFWFNFIYSKFSEYNIKNTKDLMKSFEGDFNCFFGKRFEEICLEFLLILNSEKKLSFTLDYAGNWWGNILVNGKKQEAEIDIVGMDKKNNKIMFCECKWKENVDAEKILLELKHKSSFVQWRNNSKKYYIIIAKSFKNKIKEEDVLLFDIEEMKRSIYK